MTFKQGLFIFIALSAPLASWAAPIPPELRAFLLSRGQAALVERYEAIPTVSPEEFSKVLIRSHLKQAGAGWNGAVFKDSSGRLVKLSHAVFGAMGVKEHWQKLRVLPLFRNLKLPVHGMIDFAEVAARRPTEKEVLGSLLWAAYYPEAASYLPDLVSSDGAGYRRRFVPGTPLNEILAMEKPTYDLKKIWRKVIAFQDIGERMLMDSGVMVDLLSSGNFIISGPAENPVVELVDHEFVGPSPETHQHYLSQASDHSPVGKIPDSALTTIFNVIHWPLMPDHIVQSENWKLTFEQALDYLSVRYNLSSREQAITKLASLPEWKIEVYPNSANYVNVRRARAFVANPCEQFLALPDKKRTD